VLGPLVVACAVTDDEAALRELGARDSKALSPAARERLEPVLKERLIAFAVKALDAPSLDALMASHTINEIEVGLFADVALGAARAASLRSLAVLQLDAADANAASFARGVVQALASRDSGFDARSVVAEHRADVRFPAVGAASILAKVERDRQVRAIAREVGQDIGSGYPADPVTVQFLRDYISAEGDVPPFCRRSWQTTKDLLNQAGRVNQRLEEFD